MKIADIWRAYLQFLNRSDHLMIKDLVLLLYVCRLNGWSVVPLVGPSACYSILKGLKVTFPSFYRSNFSFVIYNYLLLYLLLNKHTYAALVALLLVSTERRTKRRTDWDICRGCFAARNNVDFPMTSLGGIFAKKVNSLVATTMRNKGMTIANFFRKYHLF